MTARIFVRYRRPVHINRELLVTARVTSSRGRRIHVDGNLREGDEILAEARCASCTSRSTTSCEHPKVAPRAKPGVNAWAASCSSGPSAVHALPITRADRSQHVQALTVVLLGVALLVTMKDGRALRDTGLIATCTAVSTPAGEAGYWEACRPGSSRGGQTSSADRASRSARPRASSTGAARRRSTQLPRGDPKHAEQGAERTRTAVRGFAGLCLTTRPRRRERGHGSRVALYARPMADAEKCLRCSADMEWRHGTWQCPRCRFKLGCCEGQSPCDKPSSVSSSRSTSRSR